MSDPIALLFDRQASAVTPEPMALRSWGASHRVFVSSLIGDMPEERAAARDAIQAIGAVPVMFEHDLGAQDVTAETAYLEGVRQSAVYVGLLGPRYGVRLATGRSATHDELTEAERLGLRLCLFVDGNPTRDVDGDQRDLIDGARNLYTTDTFLSPEDLRDRIMRRLTELAAETLMPWVRVGRLLLRASSLTSNAGTLGVSAVVWDRQIVAELRQLAEQRATVPFASHLEAADAQVMSVGVTASTAAYSELSISLNVRDSGSGNMRMGMNGVDADEMAFRRLSDEILGTALVGGNSWAVPGAVNPLQALEGLGVPEAALRPIAQLLLTEHLIRNGDASSVSSFELGPARQGRRSIRLTWRPVRYYSNSPDPQLRTLDGTISV